MKVSIKTNRFEDFMEDVRHELRVESDPNYFKQTDTHCELIYKVTEEQERKLKMIESRYK